jgi:hypothetical protein
MNPSGSITPVAQFDHMRLPPKVGIVSISVPEIVALLEAGDVRFICATKEQRQSILI